MTGLMTLKCILQMSKGVISCPVKGFSNFPILTELLLAKRRPKLGIQLPNAGNDNQSCPILMFIFNQINHLWILYYNLYSITLIYTNETIATESQGYAHSKISKYM